MDIRNEQGAPVICVDLDGVLNTFDEYRGPEYFHPPRPGAAEFLKSLHERGYCVIILTVRWHEWVMRWLQENNLAQYVSRVTNEKPAANVYVDDRAICFRGDFDQTLRDIETFRPFWSAVSV